MSSLCIFTTIFSSFSENSNSIGSLILVLCHKIFSLSKFVHRQFHVGGTTRTVPEINLTRMLTHVDTWESWDQVGWTLWRKSPSTPEAQSVYYIQLKEEGGRVITYRKTRKRVVRRPLVGSSRLAPK